MAGALLVKCFPRCAAGPVATAAHVADYDKWHNALHALTRISRVACAGGHGGVTFRPCPAVYSGGFFCLCVCFFAVVFFPLRNHPGIGVIDVSRSFQTYGRAGR